MLERDELAEVASAFGVSDGQVRRDHLISHILAAIGALDVPLTFFGGTALARTYLADPATGARLSEDLDFYSAQRRDVARTLDERLPALLRREFPGSGWDPPLSEVKAVEPGQLITRDGLRVRIQVLDSQGDHHELARWPTEMGAVDLRYRDTTGEVSMWIPTLAAAAAMKTIAWIDRRTARDLYDLAGLARIDALTSDVAVLVRRAAGWSVTPELLAAPPALSWAAQLAHQTRVLPTVAQCLHDIRTAFARAIGPTPLDN